MDNGQSDNLMLMGSQLSSGVSVPAAESYRSRRTPVSRQGYGVRIRSTEWSCSGFGLPLTTPVFVHPRLMMAWRTPDQIGTPYPSKSVTTNASCKKTPNKGQQLPRNSICPLSVLAPRTLRALRFDFLPCKPHNHSLPWRRLA